MLYEAGLTAKLLLKDGTVLTILGCVEDSEARSVSNILLGSNLCLFCARNGTKVVMSTAVGSVGGGHGGGKGGGNLHRPF